MTTGAGVAKVRGRRKGERGGLRGRLLRLRECEMEQTTPMHCWKFMASASRATVLN